MAEKKKKATRRRMRIFNHEVTVDDGDETPSSSLQTQKPPPRKQPTRRRHAPSVNRAEPPTPSAAGEMSSVTVEKQIDDFVSSTVVMGVSGLRVQYNELKNYISPNYKIEAFTQNPKKNRYQDVVCLDDTRVKLDVENPGEMDYIHANWVKLEGHDRIYIASQGPLENTIAEFWRMCWQNNVFCIVMLCKMVEDGKSKCSQYWPEKQGEFKTYGKIFVNNKKIEHEDRFTMHHIEILPEGNSDSKIVKLIQFLSWPDRGVPLSGKTILRLLRFITQQDKLATGTVVIHCSAGIGRTGTIILIDWVLQKLFKGQAVDFPDLFKKLRNQRASSIQTEGQYIFIFATILEYIRAKFPTKFKDLCDKFHDEVKAANLNI